MHRLPGSGSVCFKEWSDVMQWFQPEFFKIIRVILITTFLTIKDMLLPYGDESYGSTAFELYREKGAGREIFFSNRLAKTNLSGGYL